MASKRKIKGRRLPIVDTTQARSNIDVVRLSMKQLGWKERFGYSMSKADIFWMAGGFKEGNNDFTCGSMLINKFPGMSEIMCKSNLTRSLNVMRTLFPDKFNFYPKTWFLPDQLEKFQNDARSIHENDRRHRRSSTIFIVKPSDGSEGAGIYLIHDPSRCGNFNRPYIVQEYIANPMLIDGLKFDMRIYVLILKLDPLQIMLYDEGLARFATVDYQKPNKSNLHESFMHLTNYSLNKRSGNYKHATDDKQTDASKRKLSLLWMQLCQKYNDQMVDQCKDKIRDMINKTVLAILPDLRVRYAFQWPSSKKQNRCFQIIGFDILLTSEFELILLEVNANPSLCIDFDHVNDEGRYVHDPSIIDEEVKKPLIVSTLKIVMNDKRIRAVSKVNKANKNVNEEKSISHQSINVDNSSDEDSIELEPSSINEDMKNTVDDISVDRTNKESSKMTLDSIFTDRLTTIYSSNSDNDYDALIVLEKLAYIFIELVIKHGYKAMTNRPFRNLAKACGLFDTLNTMSAVDLLYSQIFYKCKQSSLYSPATGLDFPDFIDAFLLLAQRKDCDSNNPFATVYDMVKSCYLQLGIE